uniref:Uncharacterized protein n=1 Tax=Cannabis sativa TaxID=3483 RepID=A0A803QV01_CANSA
MAFLFFFVHNSSGFFLGLKPRNKNLNPKARSKAPKARSKAREPLRALSQREITCRNPHSSSCSSSSHHFFFPSHH